MAWEIWSSLSHLHLTLPNFLHWKAFTITEAHTESSAKWQHITHISPTWLTNRNKIRILPIWQQRTPKQNNKVICAPTNAPRYSSDRINKGDKHIKTRGRPIIGLADNRNRYLSFFWLSASVGFVFFCPIANKMNSFKNVLIWLCCSCVSLSVPAKRNVYLETGAHSWLLWSIIIHLNCW